MDNKILEIKNLSVSVQGKSERRRIINNINFNLYKGEILGIVGESGSGKSFTAKSIMQLFTFLNVTYSGEIVLEDKNLLKISEREMVKIRGKRISMIFQEPLSSLNPLKRIGIQLLEVLMTHQNLHKKQAKQKIISMLEEVGINRPEIRYYQYPYELSGGMRQRILIAMALLCNPDILIADEPTTALDVTIQDQILKLLIRLKQKYQLSIIFITHDMGVIAQLVDRVMVMKDGEIVETNDVLTIFEKPEKPYTRELINSAQKLYS